MWSMSQKRAGAAPSRRKRSSCLRTVGVHCFLPPCPCPLLAKMQTLARWLALWLGSCVCRGRHDSRHGAQAFMSTLTIRHITTYRYLRPVAFGEHRMMLRPRDSHDQRVIEASLTIQPQPTSLLFVVDDCGNQIGIAQFSDCAQEFHVESVVCLELSPPRVSAHDLEEHADRFPFDYSADESADL